MAAVAVRCVLRGVTLAALINAAASEIDSTIEDLTETSCNGHACASAPTKPNKETVLIQRGVKRSSNPSEDDEANGIHEDLDAALQACSSFEKESEIDECTAHFHALYSTGAQGELKYETKVLNAFFTASTSEVQAALLQRARSVRGNRSATFNDALQIKGPGEYCAIGNRGQDAIQTWPCDAYHKCFDAGMGSEHVFAKCVSAEMECRTKSGEASGKCRALCPNVEVEVSASCPYVGASGCNCPMPGGHGVRAHVPGKNPDAKCTTIYARRNSMQKCWDFKKEHDCEDSLTSITCLPRTEGGHCQGCRSGWPHDNAGYAVDVYPCWPAPQSMGSGLFMCRAYRQGYVDAGW